LALVSPLCSQQLSGMAAPRGARVHDEVTRLPMD